MKRFTVCMVAIFSLVATGLAETSQSRVIKLPEKMAKLTKASKERPSMKMSEQQLKKEDVQRFARGLFAAKAKATKADAQAPKRRAYGDPIIENQPEGEFVNYLRNGDSYVGTLFGILYQEIIGGAVSAVFAEDGTVYLKNLITGYYCPGWVRGTVDGSKITIKLPQTILEVNGYTYYAELLQYDELEEFYVPVADETLTLDYDATTRTIATPKNSKMASGENIIGLTDDTGEWYGYGDWNFSMIPVDIEPVSAPLDLKTSQYILTADDYSGHIVNLGFDGDDIYVQGIYEELPDAWVKGTINGDKVVFKSGQYIGANTYHQFLVSATEEQVYDAYWEEYYSEYTLSDTDIIFDYDAASKTLSNSSVFLVNAGTETVNYAVAYKGATLKPFVETAATPAAPTDLAYSYMGYDYYYYYGYGWGYVDFEISPADVDGNFILPEKLSYVIYTRVNGEENVLELSPDSYMELDEAMTEIPYDFTDGWDIYNGEVYLYVTGVDAFGIQTIYRGGGEEHRSEIVWAETGVEPQPEKETPTYPELDPNNTGNSISYSLFDGSQSIDVIGDAKTQTYDVAMKLQNSELVGLHIDKVSFPLISTQNVSGLKVWLSTNLRVENGKNVPNLIEIPVTATESGFITAELPTPYTISEEGVYVGYSITVDEVDDYNAYPIVIIDQANENGLYIHTSKVYLKWMDMSEEISASTYMIVEVSGASVKDNAVTPLAGNTTYVQVGEPFTVETTIVNHGAAGISSLDVEYTLDGKTQSKHINLEEPVANLLNLTSTISNEMEALNERGNYDLAVKIVKVNGVDNEDVNNESITPVVALTSIPKHRALLEEYTGTWCGWCVRGYAALEKLAELYSDEYVLVSYHNSDPMEILLSDGYTNEFPSNVAGFPDAYVDRVLEVDPYYGYDADYGIEPMTITRPLNDRCKVFGFANIELDAVINEDASSVNVNTYVTFPFDATEANYGLEYVLVADGLTGEGSDWAQSNYYSGDSDAAEDENLAPFVAQGSYVPGLVFNDVAAQVSATNGITIEGSIPTTIVADQIINHEYTFTLADAVNTSGAPVIQDTNKLKVVAILVNNETGEVLNANKCNVTLPTGIKVINENSNKSARAEYYDVSGRRTAAPQRGVNIVRKNDGSVSKIMVK